MKRAASNARLVVALLPLLAAGTVTCGEPDDGGDAPPGSQLGQRPRGPEPLQAVQREFEAYVATVNTCTADSECTVIFPGCPLGCFVAVPEARREQIEAKARAMVAAFAQGGSACVYNCAANGPATCTAQRCTSQPVSGSGQ
jgi:hypothetical protein